jgi:hypothetical protein
VRQNNSPTGASQDSAERGAELVVNARGERDAI